MTRTVLWLFGSATWQRRWFVGILREDAFNDRLRGDEWTAAAVCEIVLPVAFQSDRAAVWSWDRFVQVRMSESDCNEEESSLEEEGDTSPRKTRNTGARLWDRVRSRLLRPKVTGVMSKENIRYFPDSSHSRSFPCLQVNVQCLLRVGMYNASKYTKSVFAVIFTVIWPSLRLSTGFKFKPFNSLLSPNEGLSEQDFLGVVTSAVLDRHSA